MASWDLLDSGILTAAENMALDKALLDGLSQRSKPLLRLYDWKNPSITFGYFSNPAQWLNLALLSEMQFDLAKRPTGGGLTIHIGDMAFSVFVPACDPHFSCCTLDNYAYINQAVVQAVEDCFSISHLQLLVNAKEPLQQARQHFCMAHPTQYDVVIDGKKVGGAAQRRTKEGFLHHGTICFNVPEVDLLNKLFREEVRAVLVEAISNTSFPLAEGRSADELVVMRKQLQEALFARLSG
ncbi:MAG: lipoate--protein ligase family protein [Parachlamydiales bacterium]|jgi:lipoate-protein ligase A